MVSHYGAKWEIDLYPPPSLEERDSRSPLVGHPGLVLAHGVPVRPTFLCSGGGMGAAFLPPSSRDLTHPGLEAEQLRGCLFMERVETRRISFPSSPPPRGSSGLYRKERRGTVSPDIGGSLVSGFFFPRCPIRSHHDLFSNKAPVLGMVWFHTTPPTVPAIYQAYYVPGTVLSSLSYLILTPYEEDIIPILPVRKLRHREVKQCYIANKWRTWY